MKELNILKNSMKRYVENQNLFTELFASINQQVSIEITYDNRSLRNKLITGVCCSRLENGMMKYSSVDGINEQSLRNVMNSSYIGGLRRSLPSNPNNEDYDINQIEIEDLNKLRYYDLDFFKNLKDKLLLENLELEKVSINFEQNIFLVSNSLNQCGWGVQKIINTAYELINRNNNEKIITYDYFSDLNDITEELNFITADKDVDSNFMIDGCHILLTQKIVGRLVYMLLIFLTEDNIKSNYTFLNNLGPITFSEKLHIEENSNDNIVINGITDAASNKRVPTAIIKDGIIHSIIGVINENPYNLCSNPSVEYRFDYRQPSQKKAQKISVKPGERITHDIINSYERVLIVSDLIGFENSLNPFTTEFTAVIDGILIENGEKRNCKKQINTSLIKIFNNIIEISSDNKYTIEGNIFNPSILIKEL